MKRTRKPVIHNPDARAQEHLKQGYDKFVAPQMKFGDGEETTSIKLHYDLPDGTSGALIGNSGKGHGHAEIDAIYQFWVNLCQRDLAKFRESELALACLDKPCCVHCSGILGLLGVLAFPGTYKFTAPAGVSYSMPPEVRKLLTQMIENTNDHVWTAYGAARL